MSGSLLNDIYSDITYTRYPSVIDTRLTPASDVVKRGTSITLIPAASQQHNPDLIINTDNQSYVMAGDINVLQDSIIAIQRTLGTMPQGSSTTVKARLDAIESMDYDARYIYQARPAGWTYTSSRDTLYTHKHSGDGITSPSKINLGSEVIGKLLKTNIQLDRTQANALTGSDIAMSPADSTTIATAIGNQFPRSAGVGYPITGDLYLNQKLYGGLYGEWDASDYITTGSKVSDSSTYSGFCARSPASASWFVVGPVSPYTKLRYGKFVLCVRLKITTPPASGTQVATIAAGGTKPGSAGDTSTKKVIYSQDFTTPGSYEMIYLTFDHKPTSGNNNFYFGIRWHGTLGRIDVDSVFVTPSHTAVYDI